MSNKISIAKRSLEAFKRLVEKANVWKKLYRKCRAENKFLKNQIKRVNEINRSVNNE